MLKRSVTYLFSAAFALFFLLAGTGVNIVRYCCAACAAEGIVHVAESSCTAVHHHHTDAIPCACGDHEDMGCSNINHHPDGCHLLRFKVDQPVVAEVFTLPLAVAVHVLFFIEQFQLLPTITEIAVSEFPENSSIYAHGCIVPIRNRSLLI